MADTIKSLADLNTAFSDNVDGIIAPQDIRDLMVSLMVHGEIGSGAKAAITLPTTYQVLDFTVAGVVGRGLTADTVNKRISGVPVDMKAEVTLELSFNGANNTTFDFAVHVNGVAQARVTDSDRIVAITMVGGIKASASLQLAAGDVIDVRGKASAAASFTLLRGLLRVRRIGVE